MYKKRPRSPDTDCEECLPISKRINRLQIESGCANSGIYTDSNHNMGICAGSSSGGVLDNFHGQEMHNHCHVSRMNSDPLCTSSIPHTNNDGHKEHLSSRSEQPRSLSMDADLKKLPYDMGEGYSPEESDNQSYFQINNVLFNAHVERCKRTVPDK